MTDAVVVALKSVTLLLGGLITFLAWRAFRRTGGSDLRLLAVGFGLVTLGSLLAGGLDQVLAVGRDDALLVESALTALGFGVIVRSLYR